MIPGLPDTLGQAKREDIPGSSRYRFKAGDKVVADITVTSIPNPGFDPFYKTELVIYINDKGIQLYSQECSSNENELVAILGRAQRRLLNNLRRHAAAIAVVQDPEPPGPEPSFWERISGVPSEGT